MNGIARFFHKIPLLFRRNRFFHELDEEMAFHRAQVERELMAGGLSARDARRAAAVQFGNATRLRERSHEVVGFRAETIFQDLRFWLRQMRNNPAFAFTAIFILALGMGVSVAIFGFVDAGLLQPLPYPAPDRLMAVDESAALWPRSNLSRDDYDDWKRMNHSFSSLEVYGGTGYLLRTPSGIEPVPARRVSAGFFDTLGTRMMLGRAFFPRRGSPRRAENHCPQLRHMAQTLQRAPRHCGPVRQPQRRRLHHCRGLAPRLRICAGERFGILGAAAG